MITSEYGFFLIEAIDLYTDVTQKSKKDLMAPQPVVFSVRP